MSLLLAVAAFTAVPRARAEDTARSRAASDAYDRGAEAQRRGDFATAAQEFARADEIAPNDVALLSALEAALHADDAALGMTLTARAAARNGEGAAVDLAAKLRAKFGGRVGRVRVACGTCSATIDGGAVAPNVISWITAGKHLVVVRDGARAIERPIELRAGALEEIVLPTAEPAKPPPPRAPEGGLSPAWVWVGLGVTAVVGGVTIWSGTDAIRQHDVFVTDRCDQAAHTGCAGLVDDGRAAVVRTNVLLGVTAAAAVVTGALALFAVRWKTGETAFVLSPTTGGAVAGLRGSL